MADRARRAWLYARDGEGAAERSPRVWCRERTCNDDGGHGNDGEEPTHDAIMPRGAAGTSLRVGAVVRWTAMGRSFSGGTLRGFDSRRLHFLQTLRWIGVASSIRGARRSARCACVSTVAVWLAGKTCRRERPAPRSRRRGRGGRTVSRGCCPNRRPGRRGVEVSGCRVASVDGGDDDPRIAVVAEAHEAARADRSDPVHDGTVDPNGAGSARARVDSASAGYGDIQGLADLAHALVAEPAETLDKRPERDALDRVEVDSGRARHGIVARLERHLARESTDRRGAGADQCAPKARDRSVTRQHHYGATADLGELTPPHLPSRWKRAHEEPAAARNDARSPHSSPASSGRRSYAA